jgi:hypothetical protein
VQPERAHRLHHGRETTARFMPREAAITSATSAARAPRPLRCRAPVGRWRITAKATVPGRATTA